VFPARFDSLQELKPCSAFLVNQFNVDVVGSSCPVRQPFATNLSAVEMNLTKMQDLAVKKISVNATVDFWRQVPKSKYSELRHLTVDWTKSIWIEIVLRY